MNEFEKEIFEENEKEWIEIPENEYEITCSRSSGPGGQNVNKTETKAMLRWNIEKSNLSEEQKLVLRNKLKLTQEGNLVCFEQSQRSQLQNRINVIEKFHRIINRALTPEKERISTKPSRGSEERRLEEKRITGKKKQSRKPFEDIY
jgi:ribosome-associated protein